MTKKLAIIFIFLLSFVWVKPVLATAATLDNWAVSQIPVTSGFSYNFAIHAANVGNGEDVGSVYLGLNLLNSTGTDLRGSGYRGYVAWSKQGFPYLGGNIYSQRACGNGTAALYNGFGSDYIDLINCNSYTDYYGRWVAFTIKLHNDFVTSNQSIGFDAWSNSMENQVSTNSTWDSTGWRRMGTFSALPYTPPCVVVTPSVALITPSPDGVVLPQNTTSTTLQWSINWGEDCAGNSTHRTFLSLYDATTAEYILSGQFVNISTQWVASALIAGHSYQWQISASTGNNTYWSTSPWWNFLVPCSATVTVTGNAYTEDSPSTNPAPTGAQICADINTSCNAVSTATYSLNVSSNATHNIYAKNPTGQQWIISPGATPVTAGCSTAPAGPTFRYSCPATITISGLLSGLNYLSDKATITASGPGCTCTKPGTNCTSSPSNNSYSVTVDGNPSGTNCLLTPSTVTNYTTPAAQTQAISCTALVNGPQFNYTATIPTLGTNAGLVFAGSGSVNPGSGQISQGGLPPKGYHLDAYPNATPMAKINYANFLALVQKSSWTLTNNLSTANNQYVIYSSAQPLAGLDFGSRNLIVFVDGDLTVTGSVIGGGGSVVFIINGGLSVDSSVTVLDGVYLFSGAFDDGVSALKLTGHGSLLQTSTNQNFGFTRTVPVTTGPAEEWFFEPKYLWTYRNVLTSPRFTWKELPPQ